jgi:ABC-type branched-subunit amino acid transport system permease subunit
VLLVRRGTTGKFLDAVRGSETAARSIGINPSYQRVVAFALSAGIAGLGGSLIAMLDTQANPASYATFFGLVWLVVVVTISARTVEGAIVAGFAFALLPELLKELGVSLEFVSVLFGLGALTYARHPEGIFEAQKRMVLGAIQRRLDRRHAAATAAGPPSPAGPATAAGPPSAPAGPATASNSSVA